MAKSPINGQTKLAKKVFNTLEGWREVTGVHWGEFILHHRGPALIKVSNGTPGLVLVQVCEPARQQKIRVHTADCTATMKAVHKFGKDNGIMVQ